MTMRLQQFGLGGVGHGSVQSADDAQPPINPMKSPSNLTCPIREDEYQGGTSVDVPMGTTVRPNS